MKRFAGYVGAFAAGIVMMGGTAWAATTYVKAIQTTSQVVLNGHVVTKPPRLIYGGTSYVQLYSIEKALKAAGFDVTWNGSTNPGTFTINTAQSGSSTGSTVINQSQLPYTFTAKDGYKLTVNSINATPQATIMNVTVANVGTMTSQSGDMSQSSIATGGPSVNFFTESNTLGNSVYNLQPGQSVTGNVMYGPLPMNSKQFTLYVEDFDLQTHALTVALSNPVSQTTPVASVIGTPTAGSSVSFSFSGVPQGYTISSMTFNSDTIGSITDSLSTAQQNALNPYAADEFTASADGGTVGFVFDSGLGATGAQFLFTFTNSSGQSVTAESPIVQIAN